MKFEIPPDTKLMIETSRLRLEPVTEVHSEELFDLFSDKELHQYVPLEVPTMSEQQARCARWALRQSPDRSEIWLNWVAREKVSGRAIGHFQSGIKNDFVASVGYMVARQFQGKGYAFEAMNAVFKVLRVQFHVQEVKAWSDTRNQASHRLAQKLGMEQIQFLPDADFFKGSKSDEYVFSKVLSDS